MDESKAVSDLEAAFERSLADLQREATRRLREALTDVRAAPVSERHHGLSVLVGGEDILRAIRSLADRCRLEQFSMHPRPPDEQAVRETEAEDRATLARGVRMRGLLTTAVRSSPAAVSYYQELSPLGLEMRTSDHLSALMMVIDREVALVHLGFSDDGEPMAMLTHSELLVQLLCDLFERTWDSAVPLAGPSPAESARLTSRQRQLLDLCGQGLKDEAIARQLGVSTRTVSAELSAAMTALGARSRFQAGMMWGCSQQPDLDADSSHG